MTEPAETKTSTRSDINSNDDQPELQLNPRQLFNKYDTDKSGLISFEEFRAILPDLGIHISIPKAMKYFKFCDSDDSGEIDFEEFQVALFITDPQTGNPVGFAPNSLLSPKDAFEMFDKDGSGKIDEDEFAFLLEYLNVKIVSGGLLFILITTYIYISLFQTLTYVFTICFLYTVQTFLNEL